VTRTTRRSSLASTARFAEKRLLRGVRPRRWYHSFDAARATLNALPAAQNGRFSRRGSKVPHSHGDIAHGSQPPVDEQRLQLALKVAR